MSISEESLNQNTAEVTELGFLGVASVYSAIALLAWLFPAPWDSSLTVEATALVAGFSWLGWLRLKWRPVEPSQAHPTLTLLLFTMALQTGFVIYHIGDPIHSANQILTMLAASFFLAARPWFYVGIGMVVAFWLPAALVGINNPIQSSDWNEWIRLFLVATVLAVALFEARRRSILRTYQLKLEAEQALQHAQQANERRLSMQNMMQESQRREALGLLAGGIAHDFNNLLAVISGNLELLQGYSDAMPAKALALSEEMDKASTRAIELTQQMLVYAGKSKPKITSIKLGERIRATTHLVASSLPRNVRIVVEGSSDGPQMSVDRTLLDQLIMNLIHNAVQACEPQGGKVWINWESSSLSADDLAELRFQTTPLGTDFVIITIRDSGIGMSEETRQKMFEPFYTTKTRGNGLGLAVVWGILESHHAGVAVTSKSGKGTTVRLAIPFKTSEVIT